MRRDSRCNKRKALLSQTNVIAFFFRLFAPRSTVLHSIQPRKPLTCNVVLMVSVEPLQYSKMYRRCNWCMHVLCDSTAMYGTASVRCKQSTAMLTVAKRAKPYIKGAERHYNTACFKQILFLSENITFFHLIAYQAYMLKAHSNLNCF